MHLDFNRRLVPVAGISLIAACSSPGVQVGSPAAAVSTAAAITAADLRSRLYAYADDSMKGRKAGTEGNNKATAYIASELRRIGVQPGGENGTYFQNVPLLQLAASRTKTITVDGRSFVPTRDFISRAPASFNGTQAIYGGVYGAANMITPQQGAGKLVVVAVPKGDNGKPLWSGTRQLMTGRYATAAAVAIVGMDGMTEADWRPLFEATTEALDNPAEPVDWSQLFGPIGFLYVSNAMGDALMGAPLASLTPGAIGRTVGGGMGFDTTRVNARNVIGIIPGSDPKLKSQYVAIGAHNDHVGISPVPADHDSLKAFNIVALPEGADMQNPLEMTPARQQEFRRILDSLRRGHPPKRDSVFNGADDDGSGTVSVLEIAEAFQKSATKPKRSLIFVWHTGEELGLYGSEWFTDHPTVPRDSIVAQLNLDMVGRGGTGNMVGRTREGTPIFGNPDYLQLVGSRRLSTELGDLIEAVNTSSSRPLKFDYSIDANGHPANIYCRSDHYSYARYGIPITFFTTGGHSDYHQLTDEPQYIEYDHMERVAKLVHASAERVANLDHRVVVDKPKPDPRGGCRQ